MTNLTISPINNPRIPEVYEFLTQAYTRNPSHVAIFGKDNFSGNRLYFKQVLDHTQNQLFIAESAGKIAGVIGMGKHPLILTPGSKLLQFTAESLSASELTIARLQERKILWDKMELKEPHYHFGPIAVLPEYQGKGVGSRMLEYCCKIIDTEGEIAYLETETIENFNFYTKFGFKSIYETTLFGIPCFFMKRSPQ